MVAKDPKAPVTNQDLDEALDAVLEGIGNLLDEKVGELGKRVTVHLDEMQTDLKFIRRDVNDLKYNTPTQTDFDDLKKRVEKIEGRLAAT